MQAGTRGAIMYLRSTLLACAVLALAATTPLLAAHKVQMIVSGVGCLGTEGCSVQQEVPFSVSFDLNTLSGQQVPNFNQGPPGCLSEFESSNLAITDFFA